MSLSVQVRNAQDVDGLVNIGVSGHGLAVYKERLNIYRWPWQKIIQFSYNRKGFSIKVRPQVSQLYTARLRCNNNNNNNDNSNNNLTLQIVNQYFLHLSFVFNPRRTNIIIIIIRSLMSATEDTR